MKKSGHSSVSAVWNLIDDTDDSLQTCNLKVNDEVKTFHTRTNERCNKTVDIRSSKSSKSNHPKRRNASQIRPQNNQSKDFRRSQSTQNLNRAFQSENPEQNRSKHRNGHFPNKNKPIAKNENGKDPSSFERGVKCMNFYTLKKLVEKRSNEILLTISEEENGFLLLLNQTVKRDLMAYILLALGKAVLSDMTFIVVRMLNVVTSVDNFVLVNIQQYLAIFQMEKSDMYHLDSLLSLITFLQKFQASLPSKASHVLLILLPLLKQTCEKHLLEHEILYSDASMRLKDIEEQNNFFLEKYTAKEIKELTFNEKLQCMNPPENYRSIPVLPNINDISQSCSFLRPNLTKGRYQDTEHYLDVQYRLLREDYVKPLRDGIAEYLSLKKQNKSFSKCRDVRVYLNVNIVKQEFVNGSLVHMACFNDESFKKIKWEYSKRFLTGSLLCLSTDDFQTMLFATVARRDPKELCNGLLFLRFEELSENVLNLNPSIHFVVLETSAYFEAYRYNLDALLQLNEDTLPLKKYIIETQKNIDKPTYLDITTTYDMRPLLLPLNDIRPDNMERICSSYSTSATIKLKNINILEDSCWPSCSELNLDPSQFAALKAAVTKEFSVIQGPPGTGKTYVGLRIAQLLLHNFSKWQPKIDPSPILVICYTNHALDQFLEGLLLFTKKIVRVGGRGKNEALAEFQLNNLKREIKAKREVPHYIFSSIKRKNYEVHCKKDEIDGLNKWLHKSYSSVLGEKELHNYMTSRHYSSLKSVGPIYNLKDDGRFIQDWLGIRVRDPDQFFNEFQVTENIKIANPILHNIPTALTAAVENLQLDENDGNGEEVDIEYIEAQRDINSDELAGISYDIPKYDDEEDELVPMFHDGWQRQGGKKELKKYILRNLKNREAMSEKEANRITNVWLLPIEHRWRLYKFWLKSYTEEKESDVIKLQHQLRNEYNELCEMRTEEDIHVCSQALVVGMTTTGAAKYRHIVQHLNPRIIIVEEAAEILESHIVTSLTPGTQHIILIGDHQQLRPNPTVHLLATKYNLNVSLFERMVENGLDCYKLNIQHRMRPEIAALLVPHIYSDLQNHDSVKNFESIKGMSKNVFFITHEYNELQEYDSKSKVNVHEAKFLIRLCKYLILQGYKPNQITVLTTYSGQLFELKRQSRQSFLEDVKFTVVDNYQGEENDIILMSFVRSNEEGQIGFLKVSNRVCVALSRARKGLFCIGNFHLLAKNSDLWKNITDTLKQNDAIGSSIQLLCQNHPGVSSIVENENDFDSVPEGGCTRNCEFRLPCGHVCSLMCHPRDPQHEEIRCLKPCTKKCDKGHPCIKKCFKECNPCLVLVSKEMEDCKHVIEVPCYLEDQKIECSNLCDEYLACGHMCTNLCGKPCVLFCKEKIQIKSPICGHKIIIECSNFENTEILIRRCKEPCRIELSCGHMCKGSCGKCRQGRLHVACEQPCKRILVCGHECMSPCSENCPPCKQPCENKCVHSTCPKKCGEPCEKCIEPCSWFCEHKKCNQICGELCDRTACKEPCMNLLKKCGHPCIGICGEPCPSECRECDEEKVTEIFFGSEDESDARFICLEDCKHSFELTGITEWINKDMNNEGAIQMKSCPKCKTVIRKSLPFGNVIKTCLEDIEKVKKITYGDKRHNSNLRKILLEKVQKSDKFFVVKSVCKPLLYFLTNCKNPSIQELTIIENVINVLLLLIEVTQNVSNTGTISNALGDEVPNNNSVATCLSDDYIDPNVHNMFLKLRIYVKTIKEWLILFIQNEYATASQQQLKELSWEIHRLKLACKLLEMSKGKISTEAKVHLDNLLNSIMTYTPFHEAEAKNFTSKLQKFGELIGHTMINISELEKQSILKAMGLTKGHWYQCPNGHVYCITECGGAMQTSTCNECGEKIGGSNHSLLLTNRVATEMDGATHSAWSEAMNLENYRF